MFWTETWIQWNIPANRRDLSVERVVFFFLLGLQLKACPEIAWGQSVIFPHLLLTDIISGIRTKIKEIVIKPFPVLKNAAIAFLKSWVIFSLPYLRKSLFVFNTLWGGSLHNWGALLKLPSPFFQLSSHRIIKQFQYPKQTRLGLYNKFQFTDWWRSTTTFSSP